MVNALIGHRLAVLYAAEYPFDVPDTVDIPDKRGVVDRRIPI